MKEIKVNSPYDVNDKCAIIWENKAHKAFISSVSFTKSSERTLLTFGVIAGDKNQILLSKVFENNIFSTIEEAKQYLDDSIRITREKQAQIRIIEGDMSECNSRKL